MSPAASKCMQKRRSRYGSPLVCTVRPGSARANGASSCAAVSPLRLSTASASVVEIIITTAAGWVSPCEATARPCADDAMARMERKRRVAEVVSAD